METVEEVIDNNAKLGMVVLIDSKRYVYGSYIPDDILEKEVYRWKFSGEEKHNSIQIETKVG